MVTTGLGAGLDDLTLNTIWAALEDTSTLVFLHPHYGLPSSMYGLYVTGHGHVLPLALSFPTETRTAIGRIF
ncbi:hypothetical protein MMC16_005836 [Acarospora aff. strigata]|nr:hypothetical protein [Acarospora aff. strigata]